MFIASESWFWTYGIGSLLDSIWNEVLVCCIEVDWDMEDPGLDWKNIRIESKICLWKWILEKKLTLMVEYGLWTLYEGL